ncbi:hypothetical protein PO587_38375 [Streptomyces gilvifuscus]|uniref:Uncharacterized protein n=1 Tax=Streptomyces gilvifuscus TaxID=1550617 RepID=A0ABT5G644_9ACTN|nr:hypothetical protein [Streptomyces gilvifuscus]MDC2960309.1 hypothetical protein [Streptomyces gilvifuscus]
MTTTPEPRSRNRGSTACVIAITPKVLVSKTSRTRAMGIPRISTTARRTRTDWLARHLSA